ncbi:MAG: insulinase family protein [Bacteroidales bacterium]|nr:insulinase family protein [Bacteroidales bacterium]
MKNVLAFLSLLVVLTNFSLAQTKTEKLPTDPAVKIGKLENGLTYYIRKNSKPENRAEFFLVVNAGAMQEEDNQDGLAHFCEHMAFNGTENFKKHDIINYLQSIGMKFGPEINAFTSHDVTNYMLQKVPTDIKENVDTALLILFDWAGGVSYEDEEIDNERGVIHEEWRTRRGADFRLGIETDKIVYEGSKYGKRDVIGSIDIIDKAPYEALRSFYKDWYRPDLQAIIAIGDFDVAEMEAKIKKQFSKLKMPKEVKERKYYEIPDHKGVRVAIASDEEARMTNVLVSYKHDVVTDKTTVDYLLRGIKIRLFNEMLNNRLREYTQKPNPAFSMAFGYYGSMKKTKDAFSTRAYVGNNKALESLEIILLEHKKIAEFGFTPEELEMAKKDLMIAYEKSFKEKEKEESGRYTWEYFSHFLNQEPIPGIEYTYKFVQKNMPEIKVEDVNIYGKQWITKDNVIVVVTGPKSSEISIPSEKELLSVFEKTSNAKVEAYVFQAITKPLFEKLPNPGKIEKTTENKLTGASEFILSNGAKVIIKKTDYKEDEILFTAFSPGGSSLYSLEDEFSAEFASSIANESGLGNYNNTELSKYLSGKNASVYTIISELREDINGNASPKDLETMLEMIHATFLYPRLDEAGLSTYKSKMTTYMENKSKNPATAFRDTVQVTLANYHPRRTPFTVETLDKIVLNRSQSIYKERFSNPGDFTFVFVGNIDPEKAKPLLEKYIGSIPGKATEEKYKDLGIRTPKAPVEKVIKSEMKVPKATVLINYSGKLEYSIDNMILLETFVDILDVRYTETIREEKGGTYGVGVRGYLTKSPENIFTIQISFNCDPEKADELKKVAYQEIKSFIDNGLEKHYLDNSIKSKIKEKEEKMKQNNWWLTNLKAYYTNTNHLLDDSYVTKLKNQKMIDIQKFAEKIMIDSNRFEFIQLPL